MNQTKTKKVVVKGKNKEVPVVMPCSDYYRLDSAQWHIGALPLHC